MMATYFHHHGGSEIQGGGGGDNLQTLYLMNPNYLAAYSSEPSHTQSSPNNNNNMLLLNPSPHALTHAPPGHQHQQQFIGIPLSGGPHSDDPGRPSSSSSAVAGSLHPHDQHPHQIPPPLHGLAVSRLHYNLWSPPTDPAQSPAHQSPIQTGPDLVPHMGFRRPTGGGLSLSLSPHQAAAAGAHQNPTTAVTVAATAAASSVSNGVQGVTVGSKYLKAAQELLDEAVNVEDYYKNNKGMNGNNSNNNYNGGESSGAHKEKAKTEADGGGGGGESSSGGSKRGGDIQLSAAQRQELQMKKAKLLNMLDEVEQRYRQYHTQMQVVVSSFEQAAGIGSAKSYTSLALQTISKQFRCLKDAITSQIKATNKSLGEDDGNGGGGGGGCSGGGNKLEGGVAGSRLRFVDHQLRQQRALQQLGMMQQNAWRPQRGLPERAVSVLRAWLFEHFLHPYPKDSDKHLLAKQTGLTRSQVSNWFINARVRLWKPMVEEMYLEEVKSQEQKGGNSEDNTNTTTANNETPTKNDHSTSKTTLAPQQHEHQQEEGGGGKMNIHSHHHIQQQPEHHHHHHNHQTTTNDMISNMSAMSTTSSQGFTLIGSSSDMESLMARSPKKQRSGSDIQNSPSSILSMDMEMKPPSENTHHHHLNHGGGGGAGGPLGFNPYIVNHDIATGRFNPDQQLTTTAQQFHGNGVSLTLGLPHCENHLSLSGNHHQNFIPNHHQGMQLGRRVDIAGAEADFCGISMGQQPSHPSNGYEIESIDIQSRKRFAAQILHDFVA